MTDEIAPFAPTRSAGADRPLLRGPARIALDSRRPLPLDGQRDVLQIVAGHADIFAVALADGKVASPRRHLFRVPCGGFILQVPNLDDGGGEVRHFAVGGLETEALVLPGGELEDETIVPEWVGRLSRAIAGPYPDWEVPEADPGGPSVLEPHERRRGPAREIAWVTVTDGTALMMGIGPPVTAGAPPLPLTSGMWIEAGSAGCTLAGARTPPAKASLRAVVDHFHARAVVCLRDRLEREVHGESQRLDRRGEQTATKTFELFDRLSAIVGRRSDAPSVHDDGDRLLTACRTVAEASRIAIAKPPAHLAGLEGFEAVLEIARASGFRVRQTLLRGEWWTGDAGPLLGWLGPERRPVALVPASKGYVLADPATGRRQRLDPATALELAPEAVTFYPVLPSRPLRLRDLLAFSFRHSRGSYSRLLVSVVALGLLSWVTPLVTQVIVTSAIPRTELDQLAYCSLALAVVAVAMTGVQTLEATVMLRIEGLLDWKLQAAIIDRVLRLPASVFRDYTVGDFVDRSLGIDSVRRVLTGRTLRSLMSGVFCWFSVALMVYFDPKLALVAGGLIAVRGAVIVLANVLRLYHESQSINLQGKVGGLVLQLLAGVGKLRIASATIRGLAVWSEQFSAQKQRFIAAQRYSNALTVFDGSFSVLATLTVFAAAVKLQSSLVADLGAFLAFFAAFGQAMAAIGAWTSGISESLVAIPHLTRLKPILEGQVEVDEGRKPPGRLSGAVEFSRVTFRYVEGGPPVLDNLNLRIAPGEYVAIVGPSGSGKSSLFRLLLGFETVESGALFLDGKSIDTLDLGAVRRQLGVVLQNGRLMSGSIYNNICGGIQLPLDQAWDAARLASLDADIRAMPMGMHTMIAEGVSTISGGQRQRIMIARAIARRPRILLLDEATSSLDNQSQAVVSAALGNLNVTRIVIAHRLSTVRDADRIIVLVGGKIVQSGTFDELSAAPGVFSEFAQRQLL